MSRDTVKFLRSWIIINSSRRTVFYHMFRSSRKLYSGIQLSVHAGRPQVPLCVCVCVCLCGQQRSEVRLLQP